MDLLLAEAEQILEMERCPQCGNPRYVCQSDDPDIDFRIYDEECNAMRKKAKYESRKSKKDNADRDGIIVGVEAYVHSSTPLDQFRDPYYEEQIKLREVREQERPVRPRDLPPGSSH
ncbi:MAG: hypothetical protein ACTH32_06335 [Microbacterium gubbeenense]|uniref:hypothetical protein n=1 Tax=Microbacterium gubbeenense TaxID=159896 RepID=UPI003F9B43D2